MNYCSILLSFLFLLFFLFDVRLAEFLFSGCELWTVIFNGPECDFYLNRPDSELTVKYAFIHYYKTHQNFNAFTLFSQHKIQ